ncbi:photosystem II 5 kDa protein, chloroplastic-like [Primulina huaijiensis]|uniref:photosystem II 5 kDa protein, chloroplastic-like n=1 Tax=Primulina huaijiensis TaxID=1492673 RepID=UPI003CC78E06
MASMTMTASFWGGSAAAKQRPATPRRGTFMVRASKETETTNEKEERSSTRRDLMFAVATAAACSVATVAMADEPKPGTLEARKKYAPVCVTMPTAKICHK